MTELVREGHERLRASELCRAMECFDAAFQLDFGNEDLVRLIDHIHARIQKVAKLAPELAQAIVEKNWEAARRLAREIHALDPSEPTHAASLKQAEEELAVLNSLLEAGKAALRGGDCGLAEQKAREVLARAPNHPGAAQLLRQIEAHLARIARLSSLAERLVACGRTVEALRALDQWLAVEPRSVRAAQLREGIVRARQRRRRIILGGLAAVLVVGITSVVVVRAVLNSTLVGEALRQARTARDGQRWIEAIACAEWVLSMDPQNAEAHTLRDECRNVLEAASSEAVGRLREALSAAEQALRINPSNVAAAAIRARIIERKVEFLARARDALARREFWTARQCVGQALSIDDHDAAALELNRRIDELAAEKEY